MTTIPLIVKKSECKQFRCIYLKQNIFSQFFCAFFESALNLEHFQKKKISLIAYVFPKLPTTKDVLR